MSLSLLKVALLPLPTEAEQWHARIFHLLVTMLPFCSSCPGPTHQCLLFPSSTLSPAFGGQKGGECGTAAGAVGGLDNEGIRAQEGLAHRKGHAVSEKKR